MHGSWRLCLPAILELCAFIHPLFLVLSPLVFQEELEAEAGQKGKDLSSYAKSMVVGTCAPKALGTLRQADGAEGFDATAEQAA